MKHYRHLLFIIIIPILINIDVTLAQNVKLDSLVLSWEIADSFIDQSENMVRAVLTKTDTILALLTPNDSLYQDILSSRIGYYKKLGQYNDAIHECQHYIAILPQSSLLIPGAYHIMSGLYLNSGNYDKAMEAARESESLAVDAGQRILSRIALRDALLAQPNKHKNEIVDICKKLIHPEDGADCLLGNYCEEYINTIWCILDYCDTSDEDYDFAKRMLNKTAYCGEDIPDISMLALQTLYTLEYDETGSYNDYYLEEICNQYYKFLDYLDINRMVSFGPRDENIAIRFIQSKLKLSDNATDKAKAINHLNEVLDFFERDITDSTQIHDARYFWKGMNSYVYNIRMNFYEDALWTELDLALSGGKTRDNYKSIFDKLSALYESAISTVQGSLGHLTKDERYKYIDDYYIYIDKALSFARKNIDKDGRYSKLAFDVCSFYKGLLLATESQFIGGRQTDNDTTKLIRYQYDDIKKTLSDTQDNAIYCYFVKNDRDLSGTQYGAFIFDNTMEYPIFTELCYEKDLTYQLSRKYQIYDDEDVYHLLFDNIQQYIDTRSDVVIIPDGLINLINIEALPIGNGQRMFDLFRIRRMSSIREIFTVHNGTKSEYAVLFGGLKYEINDKEYSIATKNTPPVSHGFRAAYLIEPRERKYVYELPQSKIEIDEISKLFKRNKVKYKAYTGINGTEETFKMLSGKDISVLHMATHGFYYNERQIKNAAFINNKKLSPSEQCESGLWHSGLILSGGAPAFNGEPNTKRLEDGLLLGCEIASMDLHGVDLVVLSACETGLGDLTTDGLVGLLRAFKKAKANTLIMTLWPVDDTSSKEFMVKFYQLLITGYDKRDAFYCTMDYIRTVYPNPKYWAAFIMID